MNSTAFTKGLLLAGAALLTGLASCRGGISEKPPLHPVLDMDFQQKVKAQMGSDLFADGRAMRTAPAGTVAWGSLQEKQDQRYFEGIEPESFKRRRES